MASQQIYIPPEICAGWYSKHEVADVLLAALQMHGITNAANQIMMVSDCNSLAAYGWTEQTLPCGIRKHHYFPSPPKATRDIAESLAHDCQNAAMIIGVGSGTINDLCKYAAYLRHIPYIIIASAPSMNGYASSGASLYHHGIKQSFSACAPLAIIADYHVLQAAPARLRSSGIGDTLCLSSILNDIALATALTDDYKDDALYPQLIDAQTALVYALKTHSDVTEPLFNALIMSGMAMGKAGSSAPASQGEHMLAHMLESHIPHLPNNFFHGEIIAVTTLLMLRLQERLAKKSVIIHKADFPATTLQSLAGKTLNSKWQQDYNTKWALVNNRHYGQSYQPRLSVAAHNVRTLHHLLELAGCPLSFQDLAVDASSALQLCSVAAFSRDRLTYLDFATPRDWKAVFQCE